MNGLLKYLWSDEGLCQYFPNLDATERAKDGVWAENMELLMESNLIAPEDGEPQKFVLDGRLRVETICTELMPYLKKV